MALLDFLQRLPKMPTTSAPDAANPHYVPSLMDIVRASQTRKLKAETWLNYYRDQQSDDLYKLIKSRWAKPDDFRMFSLNIVKKVINRRATAYAVPPVRSFVGWDQKQGEALYTAMNADVIMKKANRLTKLLKTTALQVVWQPTGPTIQVVTPNLLDAVYDDPDTPTRFIVTRLGYDLTGRISTALTTFSDWTAETYQRVTYTGQIVQTPGNPNGVNPYGVLPFVTLRDEAVINAENWFFAPGGDDLIEAQSAVNVALVNLWRAIELQSHGQAWAAGVPAGDALKIGPDRAITLPENGKFGFAAPNGPIAEVLTAIEFVIKQTAIANDLAANVFEMSPRAESGAAKAFENRDLQEARRDDQEMWRVYEARLFEVVKAVVNTHAPGTIPANASVRVDFGEVSESLAERDRLECYQRRIDMGVWSPVDCLMSDNPDVRDRTEALAELKRRREESASLGVGFSPIPYTATDSLNPGPVPFNPTDPANPGGDPATTAKDKAP